MQRERMLCLLAITDSPTDAQLLYTIVGGLVALAIFANHATAVIERFRDKAKPYATKDELVAVHGRVDALQRDIGEAKAELTLQVTEQLQNLRDEMREQSQHTQDQLSGIQRALGILEGKLNTRRAS